MLKRAWLQQKIEELQTEKKSLARSRTTVNLERLDILTRLVKAYETEYKKALKRREPDTGNREPERSKPHSLTYRKGSYNIDPWRC